MTEGPLEEIHPGGLMHSDARHCQPRDPSLDLVRAQLGKTAAELPLARILEGGTWAAGRAVARERRPGGGPPLHIRSDGTVF